jgi:WD40 repeat protein
MLWRANQELKSALAATKMAEAKARKNLHAALLAQVRMRRDLLSLTNSEESLTLLAEAAQLDPSLETRNEAILQFARRDLASWNPQQPRPSVFRKFTPPSRPIKQACTLDVSPDGRLVLLGAHNGLTLWDTATGEEIWTHKQSGFPWMTSFFSADGHELWISAREFGIEFRAIHWSTNLQGKLEVVVGDAEHLNAPKDATLQMPLANGRDWLVALDRKPIYIHRAEIWPDGDPSRAQVVANGKPMTWIHASADRNWATSVTFPSTGVRIWNGKSAEIAKVLDLPGGIGAAFTPDNAKMITRDSARYRVWEVGTWKPLGDWLAESTSIAGRIKFPKSGDRVFFTQGASKIQIRRLSDYSEILSLDSPLQLDMFDFSIRPDANRVYLVSSIGEVYEWNLEQLQVELGKLGLN